MLSLAWLKSQVKPSPLTSGRTPSREANQMADGSLEGVVNVSEDGGGMGRMGRAEGTREVSVGMAEEHAEVGGDIEDS